MHAEHTAADLTGQLFNWIWIWQISLPYQNQNLRAGTGFRHHLVQPLLNPEKKGTRV